MGPQALTSRPSGHSASRIPAFCAFAILIPLIFFMVSCGTLEKPATEPYFAEAIPPVKQEFRWTNGRMPKSFDPARATVPPETDIVRAIYEGLTVADPRTFEAIPGVAEKWSSSSDRRVWTFQLRRNAKWTNGKSVTAHDFVRAWSRLASLDARETRTALLRNFARVNIRKAEPELHASPTPSAQPNASPADEVSPGTDAGIAPTQPPPPEVNAAGRSVPPMGELAVAANGDHTLTVTLVNGDPDLPKLLADPIFSPIFGNGDEFGGNANTSAIITNGPFRVSIIEKQGVTLERSNNYWDNDAVKLDTVRFVPTETVDDALEAYRTGVVDAVTNAEFGPLVLKLLTPYEDFRRATHGALNLYEINTTRAPFSDRRVREALAISVEREKLAEAEMDGATRPAGRFIPFGGMNQPGLIQDSDRARKLLDAAGYPAGEGFPPIRLVVNRNDTQLRIARAVSRMWKQNLNIDTFLIIKEQSEIDDVRRSGDFDLIRRGVVFPTADVMSNLAAIFDPHSVDSGTLAGEREDGADLTSPTSELTEASPAGSPVATPPPGGIAGPNSSQTPSVTLLTEEQALYELRAIPLYFPTSYSLVKPYVQGFETNGLDIYSLRNVMINSGWQPNRAGPESN